ncbi:MAG: GIY-YIG nuclease family protein [Planctomycetes bacterium]|nr:GIY-YIG nuclease family protein [Planctomycetota bacterium]
MATRPRRWWLYAIRRADGAIYAGITVEVTRRLQQHRDGKGARALRGRGPLVLLFARRIGTQGMALRVELAFKRLEKREKERLAAAPRRLAAWLRPYRSLQSGQNADKGRARAGENCPSAAATTARHNGR